MTQKIQKAKYRWPNLKKMEADRIAIVIFDFVIHK